MTRSTRPISWIKAALREFEEFPDEVRTTCLIALTIAAEGGKADIAKPMQGLGSGVVEVALSFRATHSAWSMLCNSATTYGSFVLFKRNQNGASRHPNMKSI